MIRIKCPKCSHALALEDEEAGGIGECEECGAKFRVPAAKSKPAPARASAKKAADDEDEDDEEEDEDDAPPARKRRVSRDEDDEEEQEDEEEEEEEEDGVKPRRKGTFKSAQRSAQFMAGLRLCIALGGIALVLTLASLFINGAGLAITLGAAVLLILCCFAFGLAVWADEAARMIMFAEMGGCGGCLFMGWLAAPEDSPIAPWAVIACFLLPALSFIYAVGHWDKVGKIITIQTFAQVVVIGASVGFLVKTGWRDDYRKLKKKELGFTAIVRVLDIASLHGPTQLRNPRG